MDLNTLKVDSPIIGGYFSSEQIDLLMIVQCQSIEELISFIENCDQINHLPNILSFIQGKDLESAKRTIFKIYQDTMVYHDKSMKEARENALSHMKLLGLESADELQSIISPTHPLHRTIVDFNHHFVSLERDQLKDPELYDEIVALSERLSMFNSIIIGSGCIYNVINRFESDKEKRFDFYHALRDLDFAYKHGKQVRFHSLLVKEITELTRGKTKEELIPLITDYVKRTIDFIAEYNKTHKVMINGREEPVINAVDLFNEIVSFRPMIFDATTQKWMECIERNGEYVVIDENGNVIRQLNEGETPEYQNIWFTRYGMTMDDGLLFLCI